MILETERLLLRPWIIDDAEAMVTCLNNKETVRWLDGLPFPYTLEHAKEFILGIEKRKNDHYFDWAIVLKENGEVIGGTALNLDPKYKNIGYLTYIYINPKYKRNGYASEVWNKKIEFAFSNPRIEKLISGYLEGNIASKKMQEKVGAKIVKSEKSIYLNPVTNKKENQITTEIYREKYYI